MGHLVPRGLTTIHPVQVSLAFHSFYLRTMKSDIELGIIITLASIIFAASHA